MPSFYGYADWTFVKILCFIVDIVFSFCFIEMRKGYVLWMNRIIKGIVSWKIKLF